VGCLPIRRVGSLRDLVHGVTQRSGVDTLLVESHMPTSNRLSWRRWHLLTTAV